MMLTCYELRYQLTSKINEGGYNYKVQNDDGYR